MNRNDDNRFDDEVMARAARLATDVKPERDLWPGIEQAISAPVVHRRSMWNTVWAQAAAIVLLVGGSSGLTYLAMTGETGITEPDSFGPPTSLVFEPVSGSFGSQYYLGPDYIDARRVVSSNFDEHLQDLSPEARQEVLANIETIRNAIEEINIALAEDPDNVLLQELLIETYRDELDVMKKVSVISSYAMVRDDI
jgi:hypothetical protein